MNRQDGELIATIPKNALDQVQVQLKHFHGHRLCDIRVFTQYDSGEIGPTKKGISLKIEKLPELIAALQEAQRQAGVPQGDNDHDPSDEAA
jgi:hypothetical protein